MSGIAPAVYRKRQNDLEEAEREAERQRLLEEQEGAEDDETPGSSLLEFFGLHASKKQIDLLGLM